MNLGLQPFQNKNHTYDYDMQAKTRLSSVMMHEESSPLLFRDQTNDNVDNINTLSHSQSLLIDTLKGLSTVDIINVLNNNKVENQLTCKDTIVLLKIVNWMVVPINLSL